jgi:thioredoxin 1
MYMSVIHITSENFEEKVIQAEGKVLLDFWAPWCGPCQMIGPIVEELAQERKDITVGKINVDDEVQLAVQFGVASIPTLLVMEGGKVVGKAVGYRPKADIEKLL